MVLEVKMLADQQAEGANLIADRELLLSPDKSRVLEEGDPGGQFLLVAAGGTIPATEVKRLGLSADEDGRVMQLGAEPETKPTEPAKELPKPEDKQRKKPADKSVKKPATKRRSKRRT